MAVKERVTPEKINPSSTIANRLAEPRSRKALEDTKQANGSVDPEQILAFLDPRLFNNLQRTVHRYDRDCSYTQKEAQPFNSLSFLGSSGSRTSDLILLSLLNRTQEVLNGEQKTLVLVNSLDKAIEMKRRLIAFERMLKKDSELSDEIECIDPSKSSLSQSKVESGRVNSGAKVLFISMGALAHSITELAGNGNKDPKNRLRVYQDRIAEVVKLLGLSRENLRRLYIDNASSFVNKDTASSEIFDELINILTKDEKPLPTFVTLQRDLGDESPFAEPASVLGIKGLRSQGFLPKVSVETLDLDTTRVQGSAKVPQTISEIAKIANQKLKEGHKRVFVALSAVESIKQLREKIWSETEGINPGIGWYEGKDFYIQVKGQEAKKQPSQRVFLDKFGKDYQVLIHCNKLKGLEEPADTVILGQLLTDPSSIADRAAPIWVAAPNTGCTRSLVLLNPRVEDTESGTTRESLPRLKLKEIVEEIEEGALRARSRGKNTEKSGSVSSNGKAPLAEIQGVSTSFLADNPRLHPWLFELGINDRYDLMQDLVPYVARRVEVNQTQAEAEHFFYLVNADALGLESTSSVLEEKYDLRDFLQFLINRRVDANHKNQWGQDKLDDIYATYPSVFEIRSPEEARNRVRKIFDSLNIQLSGPDKQSINPLISRYFDLDFVKQRTDKQGDIVVSSIAEFLFSSQDYRSELSSQDYSKGDLDLFAKETLEILTAEPPSQAGMNDYQRNMRRSFDEFLSVPIWMHKLGVTNNYQLENAIKEFTNDKACKLEQLQNQGYKLRGFAEFLYNKMQDTLRPKSLDQHLMQYPDVFCVENADEARRLITGVLQDSLDELNPKLEKLPGGKSGKAEQVAVSNLVDFLYNQEGNRHLLSRPDFSDLVQALVSKDSSQSRFADLRRSFDDFLTIPPWLHTLKITNRYQLAANMKAYLKEEHQVDDKDLSNESKHLLCLVTDNEEGLQKNPSSRNYDLRHFTSFVSNRHNLSNGPGLYLQYPGVFGIRSDEEAADRISRVIQADNLPKHLNPKLLNVLGKEGTGSKRTGAVIALLAAFFNQSEARRSTLSIQDYSNDNYDQALEDGLASLVSEQPLQDMPLRTDFDEFLDSRTTELNDNSSRGNDRDPWFLEESAARDLVDDYIGDERPDLIEDEGRFDQFYDAAVAALTGKRETKGYESVFRYVARQGKLNGFTVEGLVQEHPDLVGIEGLGEAKLRLDYVVQKAHKAQTALMVDRHLTPKQKQAKDFVSFITKAAKVDGESRLSDYVAEYIYEKYPGDLLDGDQALKRAKVLTEACVEGEDDLDDLTGFCRFLYGRNSEKFSKALTWKKIPGFPLKQLKIRYPLLFGLEDNDDQIKSSFIYFFNKKLSDFYLNNKSIFKYQAERYKLLEDKQKSVVFSRLFFNYTYDPLAEYKSDFDEIMSQLSLELGIDSERLKSVFQQSFDSKKTYSQASELSVEHFAKQYSQEKADMLEQSLARDCDENVLALNEIQLIRNIHRELGLNDQYNHISMSPTLPSELDEHLLEISAEKIETGRWYKPFKDGSTFLLDKSEITMTENQSEWTVVPKPEIFKFALEHAYSKFIDKFGKRKFYSTPLGFILAITRLDGDSDFNTNYLKEMIDSFYESRSNTDFKDFSKIQAEIYMLSALLGYKQSKYDGLNTKVVLRQFFDESCNKFEQFKSIETYAWFHYLSEFVGFSDEEKGEVLSYLKSEDKDDQEFEEINKKIGLVSCDFNEIVEHFYQLFLPEILNSPQLRFTPTERPVIPGKLQKQLLEYIKEQFHFSRLLKPKTTDQFSFIFECQGKELSWTTNIESDFTNKFRFVEPET